MGSGAWAKNYKINSLLDLAVGNIPFGNRESGLVAKFEENYTDPQPTSFFILK